MNSKYNYIWDTADAMCREANIKWYIGTNPDKNEIYLRLSKGSNELTLIFNNYWHCLHSQQTEAINIKIKMAEAIGDLIKLYLKGVKV